MLSTKNLVFLLLVFLHQLLYSQAESYSPNQLSYRMGTGFITNHSPSMLYYTGQHLTHHEITFEQTNFLESNWGREFPNSNYGFGLSYFDLNTEVLGSGLAFYPYLNFTLVRAKKIECNFRTAIGIGRISNPYKEDSNYKNSAIGTYLNLYFSFLGEFKWRFTESYSLNLAVDFAHFSNTSIQKPNLGINIPSINTGLSYHFGEKREKTSPSKTPFERKKSTTDLSLGLGLSEIYPANGDKYLAKFIAVHRVKQMNRKSSLFYGVELFHNPAITEELRRDSIYIEKGWETSQIGIAFGHYLHLGHFALGNTIGYYAKNENPEYPSIYLGISGNYQLSSHFTSYMQLKTHKAEAEYLLIGFRYSIHE